ncbi:MAG: hypothetical protein RMY34_20870 [Aulosira sp. DedQUE10]|nr:hypothetical protein [Aulosira sp. DedQUE10]
MLNKIKCSKSFSINKVDKLKHIVWLNTDKIAAEKPIVWLRNGAEVESDRLLMNFSER